MSVHDGIKATRHKRATLKQVAKLAGVSPTTASFVMNDVEGSSISQATRERVITAAEELGYQPSAAAQSLVSGKSQTIGLVVCRAELLLYDAFVPQLLYGLNEVAHANGYYVQVEGIDEVGSDEPYRRMLHARGLDGLVVLDPSRGDAGLRHLIAEGFPIVTLGDVPGSSPYCVMGDGVGAMREATEHLLALGHRRIAHLTFSPLGFSGSDDRLIGYQDALAAAGIEVEPAWIEETGYSAASGAEAMRKVLERDATITAVTCGNDTVALGAMAALREAGLRIPEDVAVVGFDDLPFARFLAPPLTTVRTEPIDSGRLAMWMLLDLMNGRKPERRVAVTPTSLVVRASSGRPRPAQRTT